MRPIRIAFMGDLVVPSKPKSIRIRPDIHGLYDFALCNLEGACKSSTPARKSVNLHNSPEALRQMLRMLRVRYANVANNHSTDFGEEGMERLMEILDSIDVRYFGAGLRSSIASKALVASVQNARIGFIGFSWRPIESQGATNSKAGVALIPPEDALCHAIADLRHECDHVVVSFHWGYEYERYPLPVHRKLAHSAIDAGASVVFGHHPHVYQGIEAYKGRLIYYSLGNCYMPWPVRIQGDVGIVPVVEFGPDCVDQVSLLYGVHDRTSGEFTLTDRHMLDPTIEILSEALHLDEEAYLDYFRHNRVRKRGLPVFTGTWADSIRYVWLDVRSAIVRLAVSLGMWSRPCE